MGIRRTRSVHGSGGCAATVAVVATLALGGCADDGSRSGGPRAGEAQKSGAPVTNLRETFLDPDGPWREYLPGAVELTRGLCYYDRPCVEAIDSESVSILRFKTEKQATTAVEAFGSDGHRTGVLAVYFKPGGLSEEQRDRFVDRLEEVDGEG